MRCILRQCPHEPRKSCRALGECGAKVALSKSCEPGGYRIHINKNPTINALASAGLVVVHRDLTARGIATARATEKGLAR